MKPLFPTWRWFGPDDPIPLEYIRQTGAQGIVTALHDLSPGQAWTYEAVAERKSQIEQADLVWSVAESIPVSDAIKLRLPESAQDIEAWITSLRSLSVADVPVVCYNFMPVLDWTRTNLDFQTETGASALRFDAIDLLTYDIHVLRRKGADLDIPRETLLATEKRFKAWDEQDLARIEHAVLSGLPGSDTGYSREEFLEKLDVYSGLSRSCLKKNLFHFLKSVIPVAQSLGIKLAIHPDDPPFALFGLPRVVSEEKDYIDLFEAVPAIENGMTLCTGSLGARPDNNLVALANRFVDRIHFTHLRNVTLFEDGSFMESDHLDGDVDIIGVITELMQKNNNPYKPSIPFRPDHGHGIGPDNLADNNPGYNFAGRLRGMSEICGAMKAIEARMVSTQNDRSGGL